MQPSVRLSTKRAKLQLAFGYSVDKMIGHFSDLIVPAEFRDNFERDAELTARQRVDAAGVRQRRDGRRLHVLIVRVPVSIPGGKISIYNELPAVNPRVPAAAPRPR